MVMKITQLADQVRDTPLRDVLAHYGFDVKREGITLRAKTERHNIVVTGSRWFDNKANVGGGGATVPHELMFQAYDRRRSFVIAFDNDFAGEHGWAKAWDDTAGWAGFRLSSECPKHKDWNDDLVYVAGKRPRITSALRL